MDDLKIIIRQNLETKKYYLCFVSDNEIFDIWQFNKKSNLLKVKSIIENDLKFDKGK